jgi:hypothetical protein
MKLSLRIARCRPAQACHSLTRMPKIALGVDHE